MAKAKKAQSFESSLKALEKVIEKLESGEVSLDELVSQYEKGVGLLDVCEARLEEAGVRIEKLKEAGRSELEPWNPQDAPSEG